MSDGHVETAELPSRGSQQVTEAEPPHISMRQTPLRVVSGDQSLTAVESCQAWFQLASPVA